MQRKIHQSICVFVLCSLLFVLPFSFSAKAIPQSPDITAGAAYVYCVEENQVVFEKNSDAIIYPASTVKIMTGLIACEQLEERLDETVTVTKDMLGPANGYRCLDLHSGDRLTIRDLLYGAICGNDYDACYTLAYLVSGSTASFLNAMNERANTLGAVNTRYTNPTGIHDSRMVTTAQDTAVISLAAARNSLYLEISSAQQYTCSNGKQISNRNALVSTAVISSYYDSRCMGLNTGVTDEGGYCISTIATNQNYTYLCVVMNVEKENRQYKEATALLDWAFQSYGKIELITEGMKICSVSVNLTDADKAVNLYASESFEGYFPIDIKNSPDMVIKPITPSNGIDAPISVDDEIGYLTILYQGKILANIPLVTKEAVEKNGFLGVLENIKSLTGKRWLRVAFICAVLSISIYLIVVFAMRNRRKKRHRKYF